MMTVDYTITIGNIIEIGSIILGGLGVLYTLKADVTALKSGTDSLKMDFERMQVEITKLGEILVKLSDLRGEIKVLDSRLTSAEQDIREIRAK